MLPSGAAVLCLQLRLMLLFVGNVQAILIIQGVGCKVLSLAPVCPATPHLLESLFHTTFNPFDIHSPSSSFFTLPPHFRNDLRACQRTLLPLLIPMHPWPRLSLTNASYPRRRVRPQLAAHGRQMSKNLEDIWRPDNVLLVPYNISAADIVGPTPNMMFMRLEGPSTIKHAWSHSNQRG